MSRFNFVSRDHFCNLYPQCGGAQQKVFAHYYCTSSLPYAQSAKSVWSFDPLHLCITSFAAFSFSELFWERSKMEPFQYILESELRKKVDQNPEFYEVEGVMD